MKRTAAAAGMVTVGCLLICLAAALIWPPAAIFLAGAALVIFGLLGIEVTK